MAYVKFKDGFTLTSTAAIDRRIYLTKAEMLTAEDIYNLPDTYFCICPEDGKFYMYNVNNVPNSVTGKYKVLDDVVEYSSEKFEQALENSEHIASIDNSITDLEESVEDMEPKVTKAEDDISEIQTWIEQVKFDGGLVQPQEV